MGLGPQRASTASQAVLEPTTEGGSAAAWGSRPAGAGRKGRKRPRPLTPRGSGSGDPPAAPRLRPLTVRFHGARRKGFRGHCGGRSCFAATRPQPRGLRDPFIKPHCVIKYFIGKKSLSSQERGRSPRDVGDPASGQSRRASARLAGLGGPARAAGPPTAGAGVCRGVRTRGPPEAGWGVRDRSGACVRGAPGRPGNARGLRWAAGSVSFLAWPLTVRLQGNNDAFRKQTARPQKGLLTASSPRRGSSTARGSWVGALSAQSSRPLSMVSPGASAGLSASFARSCSVSCSLVGMEFFLGRPLGLVGDSRPPPCSTCARKRRRGGELGPRGRTPRPVPRQGLLGTARPSRAAPGLEEMAAI